MNNLIEPAIMEKAEINGQHVWHYLLATTIGDLHIVEHEKKREMNIVDDYMGWSNDRAEMTFKKVTGKILQGKE